MSGTAFGKSSGDDRPMKYPGQAQALCFPHSQPPTSNFQFALCFIPLVHLDKWLLKRDFPCLTLLQNDRTSSPTNQKGTVRLSEVSPEAYQIRRRHPGLWKLRPGKSSLRRCARRQQSFVYTAGFRSTMRGADSMAGAHSALIAARL